MSPLVASQVRFLCVAKKASAKIPDARGYYPIHYVVEHDDGCNSNLRSFPEYIWEEVRVTVKEKLLTGRWDKGVRQ